MEYHVNLSENFWSDEYVKSLSLSGKMALVYIVSFYDEGQDVSLEDMAASTGLEYSEAENWMRLFERSGIIGKSAIREVEG